MEFKLITFLKVLMELSPNVKSINYEIVCKDNLKIKVKYVPNNSVDEESILDYLEDRLGFDDFDDILDIEEVESLEEPNLLDNFVQVYNLEDDSIGVFYSTENGNYSLKEYDKKETREKPTFSNTHLKEINKFKEIRDEEGRSSYIEILDDFNMRLNEVNLQSNKSKFDLIVKDYSNLKYFIDKVEKDMIAVIWLFDDCNLEEIKVLEEILRNKDIVLRVCPTYKRVFP